MGMADRFPKVWLDEATALRRSFHEYPELQYDLPETTRRVIAALSAAGVDQIVPHVGRSGIVALIHGNRPGPVRALRADMDALPIVETSGVGHASTWPGRMHACGHDGHMAMLLLAARQLASHRDFGGTAMLVFQPAEENGGAGARTMLRDGLVERFGPAEIFGLHVMPGLAHGHFATCEGAMLASADSLRIEIAGSGGHAAQPQACVDPLLIASHVHIALQSIIARNLDPVAAAVISVTMLSCGENEDTIASRAELRGTVRTLDEAARDLCETRITEIAMAQAKVFGGQAEVHYLRDYPVTRNTPEQVARAVAACNGLAPIDNRIKPKLISEDFGFFGAEIPSCFTFLGQGDGPGLHEARFDFDDSLLPLGAAYWVSLMKAG